jgi:hypothetical protein
MVGKAHVIEGFVATDAAVVRRADRHDPKEWVVVDSLLKLS